MQCIREILESLSALDKVWKTANCTCIQSGWKATFPDNSWYFIKSTLSVKVTLHVNRGKVTDKGEIYPKNFQSIRPNALLYTFIYILFPKDLW